MGVHTDDCCGIEGADETGREEATVRSRRGALLGRREFALGLAAAGLMGAAGATQAFAKGENGASAAHERAAGASGAADGSDAPGRTLPPAEPDPDDQFGVDLNVNMDTIDDYLHIPGVAYRDMRLLRDPADYAAIGGDATLSFALPGFKIVPFPQVGTLQKLPVDGAYDGECLFDITWADDGSIAEATPRYEQSELIISELFPKDAPIVLCCGGAGYASMMYKLLVYLGYDPALLYNAGGMWDYTGYEAIELARHDEQTGTTEYFFWRADMATLDFETLTPLA